MNTKRHCFSCDLKDDPKLIAEYKNYHATGNVWPEVTQSLRDAGIVAMEIYLTGNRMFMVMEVDESFNLERKAQMDANNPRVQDWEELMWDYQQALPWAKNGEKWINLERVYKL